MVNVIVIDYLKQEFRFEVSKRTQQQRLSKWAATWQNQQNECAPSEDSDQSGHPPSLIRVFAVRSLGSWGPKLSSCGQRRLWSDWADAQADLFSLGAYSFCWSCHVVAQIVNYPVNTNWCQSINICFCRNGHPCKLICSWRKLAFCLKRLFMLEKME